MKKRIISAVLSAAMLGTSVFSVPFVSAETELITDSEKIYDLANDYIEQNHPGDATVWIDEEGIVSVVYRSITVGEPEFKTDDLQKYLQENNVDFSKIKILCMAAALEVPASTERELVIDSEKIYDLANDYIEQNHPGDATVWIDEEGIVSVVYRKTIVGEPEFTTDDLQKYLQENNVDFSKIKILCMAAATIGHGDIDLNNTIDVSDITELSLALIGDKELTTAQKNAADIDGDGAVTLADLARLQQYLSKKIDKF